MRATTLSLLLTLASCAGVRAYEGPELPDDQVAHLECATGPLDERPLCFAWINGERVWKRSMFGAITRPVDATVLPGHVRLVCNEHRTWDREIDFAVEAGHRYVIDFGESEHVDDKILVVHDAATGELVATSVPSPDEWRAWDAGASDPALALDSWTASPRRFPPAQVLHFTTPNGARTVSEGFDVSYGPELDVALRADVRLRSERDGIDWTARWRAGPEDTLQLLLAEDPRGAALARFEARPVEGGARRPTELGDDRACARSKSWSLREPFDGPRVRKHRDESGSEQLVFHLPVFWLQGIWRATLFPADETGPTVVSPDEWFEVLVSNFEHGTIRLLAAEDGTEAAPDTWRRVYVQELEGERRLHVLTLRRVQGGRGLFLGAEVPASSESDPDLPTGMVATETLARIETWAESFRVE